MNKTSSAITGGATLSAAAIAPLVEWVSNNLLRLSMPPQVVLIIAAGLVTAAHFVVNVINSKLTPRPYAPTTVTREAGFVHPVILVSMLVALVVLMSGCSLLNANVRQYESDIGQTIVQSAERTVCKDIPIGIWLEQYGSNPRRLQGWQSICGSPIQNPLGAETVSAILKVYPSFQQAIDATGTSPLPVPEIAPAVVESVPTVPIVTPKPALKPKPKPLAFKPAPVEVVVSVATPTVAKPVIAKPIPVNQPAALTSLLSAPVITK